MNDELERICKEAVLAYSKHYASVFLEVLRKITETSIQNSRRAGGDSNRTHPKYES
jgi:hypothetical protein